MTTSPKLTPAQERLLHDVRSAGQRAYNGRARRTVERLAALGYVEYDHVPHGVGSATERFTVRPKARAEAEGFDALPPSVQTEATRILNRAAKRQLDAAKEGRP